MTPQSDVDELIRRVFAVANPQQLEDLIIVQRAGDLEGIAAVVVAARRAERASRTRNKQPKSE